MIIAAVSDLFAVWQLIPFALVLVATVFGGGSLFFVGWRFIAKGKRASYWRSVGVHVVTTICGGLAGGLISALLAAAPGPGLVILGGLLGIGVGMLVTWAMISWIAKLSFGKAILAWLPTLGAAILVLPLLMTILLPSLNEARDLVKETTSRTQLSDIGQAVHVYANDSAIHRGGEREFPPDLQTLVRFRLLSPGHLKMSWLKDNGRACDYFYLPPAGAPMDPDLNMGALMVCSYADGHRRNIRLVLYRNGNVDRLTTDEFEAELAKPENAVFELALRATEKRLGISPADE
ncbi:MAG: hypothetical protein ACYTFO_07935 [Planctomycetota bacterium]|jgi:hypothetical protein